MKITKEFREELTDLLEEFLVVIEETEENDGIDSVTVENCVQMRCRVENAIDTLLYMAGVK